MNTEDLDLENELRQLAPRRPSDEFLRSLETRLERDAARSSPWDFVLYRLSTPLAAAASLVALFWLHSAPQPAGAPDTALAAVAAQPRFIPISSEKWILEQHAGEPRRLDDGSLVRPVLTLSVDTITWQDPKTKALVYRSVPRREIQEQQLVSF